MAGAAAAGGLQFGDDDEFEFEALGFVDGHQLHAALTACRGIGQGSQFFEGCIEDGAEQVLLAVRQAVETTPEKIEVGECSCVDAACAAQAEPDLLQPGSERSRGQGCAESRRGIDCMQNAGGGAAAICAQEVKALSEQLRNGPDKQSASSALTSL